MHSLLMVNFNLISKQIKCFDCRKNLYRLRKCFYTSYTPPIRPSKSFREAKYIAKDNIPDGFRIIYRAPMENYLSACKNITTITASLVSLLVGYKFTTESNLIELPFQMKLDFAGLQTSDSDLIVFTLGFVLVTVVLRIVINKYPLRIYRNDTKYIGIFEGQIPFKNKRIEFQKGEVSEHYGIYFNPWKGSMYKIKNNSSLLITEYFKTSSELYQMFK